MNEDTRISVRTSVGESESKLIKNSLGQGSFGAALASSLNIGCAIKDTFGEMSSTYIGTLPLNAVVMQGSEKDRRHKKNIDKSYY